MEKSAETNEQAKLSELYGRIYEADCFVKEFTWGEDAAQPYGAAVGTIAELRAQLGLDETAEITAEMISELPPFLLFAMPGSGQTRIEAVTTAFEALQEQRNKSADELSLYGSFEEKGHTFSAYMPRTSAQARQWTIVVTKDGEEVRRIAADMLYEPIFGPDAEDVATLEAVVDRIVNEL